MEKVTFIIAVLAFIMSTVSWIKEFWLQRNSVKLAVLDYTDLGDTLFYILLLNKSSLPASISHISIFQSDNVRIQDDEDNSCKLHPVQIKEAGITKCATPRFPVSLPPRAYTAHYIFFPEIPGISVKENAQLTFRIHTSRGVLTRSATLGKQGKYLNWF